MDLLRKAYAVSDDEIEQQEKYRAPQIPPPSKRKRSSEQGQHHQHHFHHQQQSSWSSSSLVQSPPLPPTEGRYVSKRERALLASRAPDPSSHPHLNPRTVSTSPVVGSIADSDLPSNILASLRCRTTAAAKKIAGRQFVLLNGHSNAASSIQWSQTHAHLLASAGMDQAVYVWNIWSKGKEKARAFRYHGAAVKDVRWSPQGLSLLSCGYDCISRLVDVEKGTEVGLFKEDQIVLAVRFHPFDSNLFLSGGSKGSLRLWDIRSNKVVHEYRKGQGPILDIEFNAAGDQFISSTDTARSNISENSLIVWDVSRQVPLSNQVYGEAFTCPCIRYHPSDACFIAQSNANYIAIFSSRPPYKLDRYKRYEGHGVWGYPIKCNFSFDGKEIASGSSDGYVYMYDYKSSKFLRKIKAFDEACVDVVFHPLLPNVIASCSWAGEICVFE